MKKISFILLGFVLGFTPNDMMAQTILTLSEAKSIAITNSYDVKMGENDIRLAEMNTSLQSVGRRPTLGLTSALSGKLSNSSLTFFGRPTSNITYLAPTLSGSASLAAQYLLWDGNQIQSQIDQSVEREKLAENSLESSRQSLLFQVENNYLNIARMYENNEILEASIAISEKRKKRATYALEYGSGDRLDLLNAKVDLNRDSIDLLKFDQQIKNAKRNLNLILNRDFATDYEIEMDIFGVDNGLSFDAFYNDAIANNVQIQHATQMLNILGYDRTINNTSLKPKVYANASYGLNYSQNFAENSQIEKQFGDGLNAGLSASWNLFDGGRTNKLNEISDINIATQRLLIDQIKDQVLLQITNAWDEYQSAILVYNLEKSNVETSKENFSRTEERFNNGQVNSITFRQAQLNLLMAQLNLASAKYDAKAIELNLMQLSGKLK